MSYEANCTVFRTDTVTISPVTDGDLMVAVTEDTSRRRVFLSPTDADRLADFLTTSGFGGKGGEESGVLKPSTSELTGGEMDSLYTTIENLIAGTASLAGKVAVLERRLNAAASEMRG